MDSGKWRGRAGCLVVSVGVGTVLGLVGWTSFGIAASQAERYGWAVAPAGVALVMLAVGLAMLCVGLVARRTTAASTEAEVLDALDRAREAAALVVADAGKVDPR